MGNAQAFIALEREIEDALPQFQELVLSLRWEFYSRIMNAH